MDKNPSVEAWFEKELDFFSYRIQIQNFDPNFEHALVDLIIMSGILQMNF